MVGLSFSPSANLDLYITTEKIGSLVSDNKGNFVTTVTIPETSQPGGVNFVIKDQQGNQKTFSTNIKVRPQVHELIQNVPLTINIDPIKHRGENETISGTASPGSTLTLSLFDSDGNPITTATEHSDSHGNYSVSRTIPSDFPYGEYILAISDGKSQLSKRFNVVTVNSVSVSTSARGMR